MPASIAATLLFAGSPLLVREFDVHDGPEAPPLAALAAVVSTATGTVIDAVSDEPIDVRPHHIVLPSRADQAS